MEILNQFGFDIRLFVAQIVNFLIIAYIFKRFLYKPLFSVIKKRDEVIKKGILDAENAQKTLEKAKVQKDEIIKEAVLEAEKIIDEARKQEQKVHEELSFKTKQDIAKMMEQARQQIDMERENLEKELKDVSLATSQKILEKAIKELFDKRDQEALMKRGIQKIKNV
jgi:F-type H+-transporting ATPase subunit b